jgi:hypothetical protein
MGTVKHPTVKLTKRQAVAVRFTAGNLEDVANNANTAIDDLKWM